MQHLFGRLQGRQCAVDVVGQLQLLIGVEQHLFDLAEHPLVAGASEVAIQRLHRSLLVLPVGKSLLHLIHTIIKGAGNVVGAIGNLPRFGVGAVATRQVIDHLLLKFGLAAGAVHRQPDAASHRHHGDHQRQCRGKGWRSRGRRLDRARGRGWRGVSHDGRHQTTSANLPASRYRPRV